MHPEPKGFRDLTTPPDGVPSSPTIVDLEITGRCNLSCRYCYYADSMQTKRDIGTTAWREIIAELGSIAVQRVILSGGEAFMRDDLFDIIDSVIENRMRYGILSNGTLITPEILRRFGEGKRRLRLDYIQVSIDGARAEIHDLSRPPKSFDRAIRGLRLLIDEGFPVTVRVTLNRHNIGDLDAIARLLLDDIGLSGFSTNEAEMMGTARCSGENILLTHEQRMAAMKKLWELNEQYGNRISANAGPLASAALVDRIKRSHERNETGEGATGCLSACGGVFSQMAILHDGTMVPCNMLPTLVMGVARMHPIRDAWLHSPSINAVRYRREIPLSSLATCSDCTHQRFCSGGCPAAVMAKKGVLVGIDPLSCYRYLTGEVDYHDLM